MLSSAGKIAIGLALAFFVYRIFSGRKGRAQPPGHMGEGGSATDYGWGGHDGDGGD